MNLFAKLIGMLPQRPLQVGDVVAFADGVATIELPGGGRLQARGDVTVGARVFVRDGVIEGLAPALTVVLIEV